MSRGARPKRTVEYKIMDNIPDYTSGRHTLPIQWKACQCLFYLAA